MTLKISKEVERILRQSLFIIVTNIRVQSVFGFESLKKYNLHIYNVEVDEKDHDFISWFLWFFEISNLLERISYWKVSNIAPIALDHSLIDDYRLIFVMRRGIGFSLRGRTGSFFFAAIVNSFVSQC